jgi:hypothetical protein
VEGQQEIEIKTRRNGDLEMTNSGTASVRPSLFDIAHMRKETQSAIALNMLLLYGGFFAAVRPRRCAKG